LGQRAGDGSSVTTAVLRDARSNADRSHRITSSAGSGEIRSEERRGGIGGRVVDGKRCSSRILVERKQLSVGSVERDLRRERRARRGFANARQERSACNAVEREDVDVADTDGCGLGERAGNRTGVATAVLRDAQSNADGSHRITSGAGSGEI